MYFTYSPARRRVRSFDSWRANEWYCCYCFFSFSQRNSSPSTGISVSSSAPIPSRRLSNVGTFRISATYLMRGTLQKWAYVHNDRWSVTGITFSLLCAGTRYDHFTRLRIYPPVQLISFTFVQFEMNNNVVVTL